MAASSDPLEGIIQDEQEFLDDVEAFMQKRGVTFDRRGRVAGRSAPLHKMYKLVMERGGYDAVTASRMMWRELTRFFDFPPQHEGAMSYQLKMTYYKNLAAYEIEKYWGEKAPPPEMLEQTTAKGGDLRRRMQQENGVASMDVDSAPQSPVVDGSQTPSQPKLEAEEPGSANRYPSRARQQPKPMQTYQPDPVTRNVRARNSPPTSAPSIQNYTSTITNPRDPNFKLESYEPRPQMALTLRPVVTPGTNSELFYQRKNIKPGQTITRTPLPQDLLKFSIQKAHFEGPNIYIRCVQGLKSGIEREEEFALHHLVKVSHERGDKFKFEGFPTLAETLMEKVVQITDVAFGIPFDVSYMDARGAEAENTINAVHGTTNLRERLLLLQPMAEREDDGIRPEAMDYQLERLNEAALVLRNMSTLEENAIFLSKLAFFKDVLILLINLPKQSRFDEIRQYGLDMAEMTTRYWSQLAGDGLYASLLEEVVSSDRGKILPALRALYRFDAELDRIHRLTDFSEEMMRSLAHYCVLDDDELVEAAINVLYSWTASSENMLWIMKVAPDLFPGVSLRLTNMLTHNAIAEEASIMYQRAPQAKTILPASIPNVPKDLFDALCQYPENERSSRWLKCCFEEHAHADVTQISIWQAYSGRFQSNNPIAAADFIKNVSTTLHGAQAQVVPGPQGQQRFIIKGIRPRRVLQNLQGEPYFKCHWQIPTPLQPQSIYGGSSQPSRTHSCGEWSASPAALWKHVLASHVDPPSSVEGSRNVQVVLTEHHCGWINCSQAQARSFSSPRALAQHVRYHIPETAKDNHDLIYSLAHDNTYLTDQEANKDKVIVHQYYNTMLDEKNHPCGIPFMSCLVLMNLARFVGRHGDELGGRRQLMGKMMDATVTEQLADIFSKHRTIAVLLIELMDLIESGKGEKRRTFSPVDEMIL